MPAAADLIVASGTVKDGRLFIRNRKQFDEQVRGMREGWELEVTVQRRRATRSPQANAYYWGVALQMISEYTGDEVEDLHEHFKVRFLPKKLHMDGDEIVIGGSTRSLNVNQFYEYVERIRRFAAEFLDCNIPDPGFS